MSGSHGFLNVCKPRGWTSHDVVAKARRIVGTRQVGHAGTLDPLAEGVLPLAINRATRLVDRVVEGDKAYSAEVVFGVSTDTLDAEGAILATAPVASLSPAEVEGVLARFRGPQQQVPPAYSAIKVGGQRAYDLARGGRPPALEARPVMIHSLELAWLSGERVGLNVSCSKGTYIRALARDLGEALGCGAHLARLVRTRVAGFALAEAVGIEELTAACEAGRLADLLLPVDEVLAELPSLLVDERDMVALRHGSSISATLPPMGEARVYSAAGQFLGIVQPDDRGCWRPRLVLEAA